MTHAEAIDEAKKRWGADGFVWSTKNYGDSKPYCYVVGSRKFEEPLGTSGECWEAAFQDADLCRDEGCPHFGTKHICRRTNQ